MKKGDIENDDFEELSRIEAESEKKDYKKYHDRWRLEKYQIGRRNFN